MKKFIGLCVLGTMFVLSGCGQPSLTKNMKPGDEAYSCGVYSVIKHKNAHAITVSVWSYTTETVAIDRHGYFRYGGNPNKMAKRFFKRNGKYYFNPNTNSDVRDSLQLIECRRVK